MHEYVQDGVTYREEDRRVSDGDNNLAAWTKRKYRLTDDMGPLLVQETVHVDAADQSDPLVTTYTWHLDTNANYRGSYGQIALVESPDGSWTEFEYDGTGRVVEAVSPWGNTLPDTPAGDCRQTLYFYTAVDIADSGTLFTNRPRTVVEQITGIEVGRTYYAYLGTEAGGYTQIVEQCAGRAADYGDEDNLRTVTVYYGINAQDGAAGQVASVAYPDGRKETHVYESCVFTNSGEEAAIRLTVTHGTIEHPEGVAGKSTVDVTVESEAWGHALMRETYVYTGQGALLATNKLIDKTVYEYDEARHVTRTRYWDGRCTRAQWDCCHKEWDEDRMGVRTWYEHDEHGRLVKSTTDGFECEYWWDHEVEPVTNAYLYSASGRVLRTEKSGFGLTAVSANRYDLAGRLTESIGEDGGTNTYGYGYSSQTGISTESRTNGVGETETRRTRRDGEPAEEEARQGGRNLRVSYTHGVAANGERWTEKTQTDLSDENVMRTAEREWRDLLGRTVRTVTPAHGGGSLTNSYYFNVLGQLARTETPGMADTLRQYDALGSITLTALDVDSDGQLDLGGPDRVSGTETGYAQIDGDWWQVTASTLYSGQSGMPFTNSVSRERRSGLAERRLFSESVTVDAQGNETTSLRYDYGGPDCERYTAHPDGSREWWYLLKELTVEYQSRTRIYTSGYDRDAFGRVIGEWDWRRGESLVHYDDHGRVDFVEDAAGNRTAYEYDAAGRRIAESNAVGWVYWAYDAVGNLARTWGDRAYPVQYGYDAWGRMTNMITFRGGEGWSSPAWPTNTAGNGDETVWHYDTESGLLTNKEYADGKGVSYTYTPDGRLRVRTWARGVATTNAYDALSGELTNITYSATDTPGLTFTYDRLGRIATVTDGLGNRAFHYGEDQLLNSEAITGLYTRVIERVYDEDLPGRPAGFNIGDFNVGYRYPYTRPSVVTWSNAAGTATGRVDYLYLDESDLISGLTSCAGGTATNRVARQYEAHRDLVTNVLNEAYSNGQWRVISSYGYTNDASGRRAAMAYEGAAFAAAGTNRYAYNDRSELTNAAYCVVPTDDFAYEYDNIGNRLEASSNAVDWAYLCNEQNQYTNITDGGSQDLLYDADGNLTNDGVRAFFWDVENRMVRAEPISPSTGSARSRFAYDYVGRRIMSAEDTWDGSGWTDSTTNLYVYDGWNLAAEIQPEATNYWVWGLDLSGTIQGAGGIGGLLAWVAADGSGVDQRLYFSDANGNIAQVIGLDGALQAGYQYGPFGEAIQASGPLAQANRFRFSSKPVDDQTGHSNFGYRLYDAPSGRWLSRDPIGEDRLVLLVAPSEIQNLYLFVRNNAIVNHDELGLSCCGPDVTERMRGEIRRLRGYFGRSPALAPTATRPARIVNATKKLWWFARVALSLNYAKQDLKYNAFVPTIPNCKDTLTLCGKCVGDDLPGNILFGLSAQLAGISQTVRNRGAAMAEVFTDIDTEIVEPPDDKASFDLGTSLGTSGSDDICSVAGSIPASKLGAAECTPVVSTPRNFTPAFFHTIGYPEYITRIWPW